MKKILKNYFCFKNIVIETNISKRLDVFLKNTSDFNWGQIQQILKKKRIRVKSEKKTSSSYKYILKENDEILIPSEIYEKNFSQKKIKIEKEKDSKIIKDEKYINSIFNHILIKKEKNYLVINKPNGLYSQGTNDLKKNLYIISKNFHKIQNLNQNLHLVHRLDYPVSGLILIASNKLFAQKISEKIKNHEMKKTYKAIVEGIPFEFLSREKIEVEFLMKFNKNNQRASFVSHKSNNSVKNTKTGVFVRKIFFLKKDFTEKKSFRLEDEEEGFVRKFYEENKFDYFFYSEIEFDLKSGKRHQLRALSKDVLKCSILFDKKYDWNNEEISLEKIIHKKLISDDFVFSKDEILQSYYKDSYKDKDYIYLHSESVILDNFEVEKNSEKLENSEKVQISEKEENFEEEKNNKIQYSAEYPAHFKLFFSFFEN